MSEQVNHPSHYNMGGPKEADGTAKYEAIKVIEDWGLGFCFGNALKYILRAPHKGSEKTDYDKARWYLDRAILNGEKPAKKFSLHMTPAEVAEGWNLPPEFADILYTISAGTAARTILLLDAFIITKAARGS